MTTVPRNFTPQDIVTTIHDGLAWRHARLSSYLRGRLGRVLGLRPGEWSRVVMDRETRQFVGSLDVSRMDALEISGVKWQHFGFRSYRSVSFPPYDVCVAPLERNAFDIIFMEQVLEHVLWPLRAVRHAWHMLRPAGVFVVTTPFLVKLHHVPVDCSRWTELGLKHLLAEGGFALESVTTGSWGNRACVRARLRGLPRYLPWWHSLRNEPNYPVVVWAFARKQEGHERA